MQVVVGVAVLRDGRVLAARRGYPSDLAGRWEFPGGKADDGEAPEDAAVREVVEELGCAVRVTGWLTPRVEVRAGLELRVATAVLVAGEPVPRPGEHDAVLWVAASGLDDLDWLPADRPFVTELAGALS